MKFLNIPYDWISRESAPVDWCEENYAVSVYIAEFVNTISNILFLTVPLISVKLWSSYAHTVTKQIYVTWALFIFIGLSSAYFHATLSFLGQILDELSILWLLVHVFCFYVPYRYRLGLLRSRPGVYKLFVVILGVITTLMSFCKPEMNQYLLMIPGLLLVSIFAIETKAVEDTRVKATGKVAISLFLVAITVWISDKVFCDVWKKMRLTVWHGLWHIVIFLSTYAMQSLACLYYAQRDVPDAYPTLMFWPHASLGIPYVHCHTKNNYRVKKSD